MTDLFSVQPRWLAAAVAALVAVSAVSAQADTATTPPPGEAKVPGTDHHATGNLSCSMGGGQPEAGDFLRERAGFVTTMEMRLRQAYVVVAVLVSLWSGGATANVPFWGDRESQPVEAAATGLKQGQWVWNPASAPEGPVVVIVSLDQQLAYAYRNGILIGYASVSTGKKGYETPTGVFHTLQKDKDHRSSIYNNAPMPYTQRLTWGGVSLHAGGLPGYPSSHGCVHLPSAFAAQLYEVSPMGMTVVVARSGTTPEDLDHPLPISPVNPQTGIVEHEPSLTDSEAFRWTPDNAPSGPLSVIVSRADQRVLVLRNGVEIGRARVTILDPQTPFGTHAFVVRAVDGGKPGWVGVAVPGHADEAGRTLDPRQLARVRMPRGFLDAVRAVLQPGATLVVTDAGILPHTTGTTMTVVTNQPPEA